MENRSRFGLEVVKAVKEAFGRNVSIKLSPAGGYNDVGYVYQLLSFVIKTSQADLLLVQYASTRHSGNIQVLYH